MNGMDAVAALPGLDLRKPPLTQHPGSRKSIRPRIVTAACGCEPGQVFSVTELIWTEQREPRAQTRST